MMHEVTSHTLLLVIVTEKLLVLLLVLLPPCKSAGVRRNMKIRHWHGTGEGKMCVVTVLLQSFNNTVSLFRGEMAGDVDSEHVHQSPFSAGYSIRQLGKLYGIVVETSKPCVTETQ